MTEIKSYPPGAAPSVKDEHLKPDTAQLCFTKARGKVFRRLLDMDPEVLWQGLLKVPYDTRKDFLNRIPFDSPLKPVLEKALKNENIQIQGKVDDNEFETIIYCSEFEEGLEERERIQGMVISKLNQIDTLPTLPDIANQVMMLAADPESSIDDMTRIIVSDPPLTSKLLQIVNSPFYGFLQKVGTVKRAVSLLGTDEVVSIAFGLAVAKVIDTSGIGHLYPPKALWHHSIATGLIAHSICREFPKYREAGVFTAGLLHDFGKIFLIEKFPEYYGQVHSEMKTADVPIFELEEEVFGINHQFIGEHLASNWNLPEPIVHAIAFHHHPASTSIYPELAAIIGLADYLYHEAALIWEPTGKAPVFPSKICSAHFEILSGIFRDLNLDRLKKMTGEALDLIRDNNNIFNILN